MQVLIVVSVLLAALSMAGCGEADEAMTAPAGGTTGSPTIEDVATSTNTAATATRTVGASPSAEITSRYFLRVAEDAGQPPSAELVQAASNVVKQRLETFLRSGVRISPDPAFPDLIGADIATAGLTDTEMATILELMTETGLMEIIDTQGTALPVGTMVSTTLGASEDSGPTYETVVSGMDLARAFVSTDQFGAQVVGFELGDDGSTRFEAHTRDHIGQPMSIVIDKRVVNTATIQDTISGEGVNSGLTGEEVMALAIQLQRGALPIALSLTDDPGTPPLRVLPTVPATPT